MALVHMTEINPAPLREGPLTAALLLPVTFCSVKIKHVVCSLQAAVQGVSLHTHTVKRTSAELSACSKGGSELPWRSIELGERRRLR